MQLPYLNLLSVNPHTKKIPYIGNAIGQEIGERDHGFKNLVAHPELINDIPEIAMKFLIYSLNFGNTKFFTTGCFSREIVAECSYAYHGYLEFPWNCQNYIRDAINYFSLFFHFEQFLHHQNFRQKVEFL